MRYTAAFQVRKEIVVVAEGFSEALEKARGMVTENRTLESLTDLELGDSNEPVYVRSR